MVTSHNYFYTQGFQIRESIGRNRDNPVTMEQRKREERKPRSCLPDKLSTFTARKAEIQKVIAFLNDDKLAVVSLYGGPGFGKTAIAIEVSHKLSEDLRIPVVFTQLSTANNVDEMVLRVCRDVGVNYEDDPMSALIFWLRNIEGKVIFVMDDIDNLLEEKASFYEFVCLLRKNSNQHCQIVTTSRTSFEIPKLHNNKVQIDVMDGEACVQLLKNQCPQQDDDFLRKLAELCGNIPLAMCIAGSRVRDFKNSDELLQHLEEQPMQTLECPESDQYVNRAINMSYEKCSEEEQQTIVRLSVFEGSFSEDAVRDVIEKKNLDTARILKKLVSRSLIKQTSQLRYSIHLLIKHFLNDKQESGDERAQKACAEAVRAKVLMVEHYLELGHQHTMESYSKDGYKDNREALKREALNIQNVLKICCQQEDQTSTDISDCLVHSKIYTTSARFFSLIVRTIIPEPIVDEFLRQCAKLAKERKQHAIKINFDCLLADQARTKSIGRSDEQFILYMKEIKREFETYYEDLKDDKSLCGHFYYLYGRYLLRKSESHGDRERSDLQIEAEKQLEKSLELRKSLTGSEGKADNVFSLLHLGNACKKIFGTARFLKKGVKANASLKEAKRYYEEAIQLSEENLGEHELTSSCYKPLGDLYLTDDKPDLAEKMYTTAKNMRENLGLDASERYVFLLNNLAGCLTKNGRINEAIEVLEKARDTAEKLAQGDKLPVCQTRVYGSLAIAYDSLRKNSDAVTYARKALKFEQAIIKTNRYKLKKILEGAD